MIYLWVRGYGWKEFDLSDKNALDERTIKIGDGAKIGNGAEIGDRGEIGDRAEIGNGAEPVCIYITGSRHRLAYWGDDRIDIGCRSLSISGWLEDGLSVAQGEGYSEAEIDEYRGYVEFVNRVHGEKQDAQ